MMNKNGGYTWLQTCATIICNAKNPDEQNIICVNYVVSGKEDANLILDSCQLEIIKKEVKPVAPPENSTKSPENDPSNDGEHNSGNFINDPQGLVKLETYPSGETRAGNAGTSGAGKSTVDQVKTSAKTEEPAPPTPSTRGRKRKVKADPTDDTLKKSSTQILPPQLPAIIPQNQNIMSSDHVDHQQQQISDETTENSVKNLENVMSKHLPSNNTDFSTDSLLKQQEKNNNVQWSYPEQQQNPSPVMPATSLLRQLYANRESVIRATTLYSDTGALPTPPSDYDNQFAIHSQNQKQCESYNNLNYGGSYSSNVEYNQQMTPPSSVSPRDASNLNKNPSHNNYEYTGEGRSSGYQPNDSSLPSLPLKPQAYSIHPHPNPVDAYGNIEYFTHHPGFHFYHKGTSSPWYPTPS
jgi:neuronal PAS domain-containing protein 1/3